MPNQKDNKNVTERLCTLCLDRNFLEIEFEEKKFQSAHELLQPLWSGYGIKVEFQRGEGVLICEKCLSEVFHMVQTLKRWQEAQKKNPKGEPEREDVKPFYFVDAVDSKGEEFLMTDIKEEPQCGQEEEQSKLAATKEEVREIKAEHTVELAVDEMDRLPKEAPATKCVALVLSPNDLILGRIFKHPANRSQILCTCCSVFCDYVSEIRSHSSIQRRSPKYLCRDCGSITESSCSLLQHRFRRHPNASLVKRKDVDFRCKDCGQHFDSYISVMKHITTHSPVSYPCTYSECTASFKYKTGFQRHLQWHKEHQPSTSTYLLYRCKHGNGCKESFRSWVRYKNHIRMHR